jgi:hypothetical protein
VVQWAKRIPFVIDQTMPTATMIAIKSERVSEDAAFTLLGGTFEKIAPATANSQKIDPTIVGPRMNFGNGQ